MWETSRSSWRQRVRGGRLAGPTLFLAPTGFFQLDEIQVAIQLLRRVTWEGAPLLRSTSVVGTHIGAAALEDSAEGPQKTKNRSPLRPSSCTSRYLPKGHRCRFEGAPRPGFIAALPTTAKVRKEPKRPSTEECSRNGQPSARGPSHRQRWKRVRVREGQPCPPRGGHSPCPFLVRVWDGHGTWEVLAVGRRGSPGPVGDSRSPSRWGSRRGPWGILGHETVSPDHLRAEVSGAGFPATRATHPRLPVQTTSSSQSRSQGSPARGPSGHRVRAAQRARTTEKPRWDGPHAPGTQLARPVSRCAPGLAGRAAEGPGKGAGGEAGGRRALPSRGGQPGHAATPPSFCLTVSCPQAPM